MDDEIVFNHTYYFVNETIPEIARQKIPCSCFDYYSKSFIQKLRRRLQKIRLRLCKYQDYPFLKTAELFAYDLPFLSLCIGNHSYSSLSDAPNWLTVTQPGSANYIRRQKKANSLLGKIQSVVFGDIFVHYLGNNKQCKAFYLTEKNTSPVLEGKSVYIHTLESMYENSSVKKRQFLVDMFGITREEINLFSKHPNLFFSQPFLHDCDITEEEYIELLQKIFRKYPKESIIIKTHPRDDFDYAKYFPELAVFSKSISSQFLYMIGVRPHKLITIASTAIEGFPESIECDYYGTSIHPKVEKLMGKNIVPGRKVNFISFS